MISEGHIDALVEDFSALKEYWEGMAREYPSHPVASDSRQWSTSLGYTLYCNWIESFMCFCFILGKSNLCFPQYRSTIYHDIPVYTSNIFTWDLATNQVTRWRC